MFFVHKFRIFTFPADLTDTSTLFQKRKLTLCFHSRRCFAKRFSHQNNKQKYLEKIVYGSANLNNSIVQSDSHWNRSFVTETYLNVPVKVILLSLKLIHMAWYIWHRWYGFLDARISRVKTIQGNPYSPLSIFLHCTTIVIYLLCLCTFSHCKWCNCTQSNPNWCKIPSAFT